MTKKANDIGQDNKPLTLFALAHACWLYAKLTNESLNELLNNIDDKTPNINKECHRQAIIDFLNDWGCRQFASEYHALASRELKEWGHSFQKDLPVIDKNLLALTPNEIDADTGLYPGRGYDYRLSIARYDPAAMTRACARLRGNLVKAEKLLALARPKTDRQRYRVRLWRWAHDVLRHFCDFGPQVLIEPGAHDAAQLRRSRAAAVALSRRTEKLLQPLLTDRTLQSEQQTRFGTHLEYINEMIGAAKEGQI